MAETLVLDPVSEDAANSPLTLTSGSYGLTEHKYPQPAIDPQWASSVSTEGSVLASQRYQNREISITVEVDCTTNLTPLRTLQAKLTKLAREGGTLQRTMGDATVIVFDVLTADGYDPSFDQAWHLGNITTVSFTLTCAPFGRGTEQSYTLHTESTLPVNIFTETAVKGDLPARGRLVISDAQAVDQRWVAWGVQSRYYDSATSAALYYEAEGRTALGGSAIAAGPTGASGAGSNVMRNTVLTTGFSAILSTQAISAGAHLTHVGTFRVFARVQVPTTNSGNVSVALEWGVGDFRRFSRNTTVDLDPTWEGTWRIIDLGVVPVPKVATGSQRWEGRILAKSTVANDDVDVDWLALFPVDEGYGEVKALYTTPAPTTYVARDEFDQTAGALTAKTLPVGGTWAGAGDTDDFTVNASSHKADRTTVADVDEYTGRYGIAGATSYTTVAVQADVSWTTPATGGHSSTGVLARYTDTNNWLRATVRISAGNYAILDVTKRVAGTATPLWTNSGTATMSIDTSHTYSVRLTVDTGGRWQAWIYEAGTNPGSPTATGVDADLATGGTLATGKIGIYDYGNSSD